MSSENNKTKKKSKKSKNHFSKKKLLKLIFKFNTTISMIIMNKEFEKMLKMK
jgi:hypothetical protein